MRIIAGARKGLRLHVPAGRSVRPTSDRAREGLMSALGGFFDGEAVLDLCAGSGAMSLELLSRGCGHAVLVEHDRQAAACIIENTARAAMGDRVRLLQSDVLKALTGLRRQGEKFHLVIFDPPYDGDLYTSVLGALEDGALLHAGAEVVVESKTGLRPEEAGPAWSHGPRHRYGRTTLERLYLAAPEPSP